MDLSVYLSACDGGYITLIKGTDLIIKEKSQRFEAMFGSNVATLSEMLTSADRKVFFQSFKQNALFSVRSILVVKERALSMPVSLKCLSIDQEIYCLVTLQTEWYSATAAALQHKNSLERLLKHSKALIIETNKDWVIKELSDHVKNELGFNYDENFKAKILANGWTVQNNLFDVPMNIIFEKKGTISKDNKTYYAVISSVVNKSDNIIGYNIYLIEKELKYGCSQNAIVDERTGAYNSKFMSSEAVKKYINKNTIVAGLISPINTVPLNKIVQYLKDALPKNVLIVCSDSILYLIYLNGEYNKQILNNLCDHFNKYDIKIVIQNYGEHSSWNNVQLRVIDSLTKMLNKVGVNLIEE